MQMEEYEQRVKLLKVPSLQRGVKMRFLAHNIARVMQGQIHRQSELYARASRDEKNN